MRALEMVGTFSLVLFMIGFWNCSLDYFRPVEGFLFTEICVWQSVSYKVWCPKALLPLKIKILILRPIVRAPHCDWLLVLKSSILKTWKSLRPIVSSFGVLWLLVLKSRFSELRPIENAPNAFSIGLNFKNCRTDQQNEPSQNPKCALDGNHGQCDKNVLS